MQHIITDKEMKIFWDTYNAHQGHCHQATITALTDFLNNRPQVAQLRPIAEMPEKVPEGCARLGVSLMEVNGCWHIECVAFEDFHKEEFFVDFQLPTPDPDAEERRQFEEAMKQQLPDSFEKLPNGDYRYHVRQLAWTAWKLAKKGGDK